MTEAAQQPAGEDPIFASVFGTAWRHLPPVMKKHYANRPFSNDTHVAKGEMAVRAHWLMRLFAPASHALGAIPIANEDKIPVTVTFRSEPDSSALIFDRLFHLKGRAPYRFRSRMVPLGANWIVEQMRMGLGWRVAFSAQGGDVTLAHMGYALCLRGMTLPLPLDWLLGRVSASEWTLGPDSFGMAVTIDHWLLGRLYEYRGTFQMVGDGVDTSDG